LAIYRTINHSPNTGETLDMSLVQVFKATATSKITDYQLVIYDNSTNTLLYDSTKISLSTVIYGGDVIQHEVPITSEILEVRDLKWTMQVWNGSETLDSTLLRETYFKNYGAPTISLSVNESQTSQKIDFVAIWSHPQDIEPLRYKYTLYDTDMNELDNSDWVYSESLAYSFEGFLNNTYYNVKVEAYDKNNIYTVSSISNFLVSYPQPTLTFEPFVETLPDESCNKISWGGAYSIEGTLTGTSEYLQNYFATENYGIRINELSNVAWNDLEMTEEYTVSFIWTPETVGFSGAILKLENTTSGHYYEIGFENNKFYRNVNGEKIYTTDYILKVSYAYIFGVQYGKLYIVPIEIAQEWNTLTARTWGDLTSYTWDDILNGI